MGTAGGKRLGRVTVDGRRNAFDARRESAYQLAQDGIDEWRSRTFSRPFDELHTLMNGGTCGYAAEPAELVNCQAQRDKDFQIQSRESLDRGFSDLSVKQR